MFSHNINSTDAYKRPIFSSKNKIKRLLWQICWFIFCRWTPAPLHGWRAKVLRLFGAKIGNTNFIYSNCKIWAPWLLETEDVVTIGRGVEIYNPGGVFLGHHAILSQDAYVCGATHDYNSIEFTYLMKKIVIEPYVWICAKAIVLPGVQCNEGSILAAGSIATKNMNRWMVYGGNPAKPIKQRVNFLKSN
ncbi:MAG: putative colanic acid biosynthesis acetyltransferase [Flavobacterium sp.]|nr:putative colanic acid biosynthesis acetyltransferase [Flavobacterium sp.]